MDLGPPAKSKNIFSVEIPVYNEYLTSEKEEQTQGSKCLVYGLINIRGLTFPMRGETSIGATPWAHPIGGSDWKFSGSPGGGGTCIGCFDVQPKNQPKTNLQSGAGSLCCFEGTLYEAGTKGKPNERPPGHFDPHTHTNLCKTTRQSQLKAEAKHSGLPAIGIGGAPDIFGQQPGGGHES